MKKFFSNMIKTVVAMVISLTMLISVAACGAPASPDSETDLEIFYWRAGWGVEYLNKIIDEFKKDYPQYNVMLEDSADIDKLASTIERGGNYNSIDLYICGAATPAFNKYFEPLNDLLNEKNINESKTLGEKFYEGFIDNFKATDGNIYMMPDANANAYAGLVYNTEIINGTDFEIPKTTDELEILAMQLKDAGHVPFIYFPGGTYWQYVYNVWQAQYDGLDYYTDVFYASAEGFQCPNKDVMLRKDGRYQVLKTMEKFLTPDYIAPGSNSEDFTVMQTKYLNGLGVMMPNGDWLANEMQQNFTDNEHFLMMKTPVISSIRDKCLSIGNDAELSALITAVDAVTDKSELLLEGDGYEVTQEDANRIYDARNYMTFNGQAGCYVPNYSAAKGAAKDFIKFFYSDISMQIVADELQTAKALYFDDGRQYDTTNWSEWSKRLFSFKDTAIPIFPYEMLKKHDIFSFGGAMPYASVRFIEKLSALDVSDRKNADQLWDEIVSKHNADWENYLRNAGII